MTMLTPTTVSFARTCKKAINQLCIAATAALMTLGISVGASAAPVQYPLFISNPVKPIMMLNMSRDHQLFFKLYDDYSDIWDMRTQIQQGGQLVANSNYDKPGQDGMADTTYIHKYRYYGYFDSDKCYTYANNLFSPSRYVHKDTRYCNYGGGKDEWSGNLLNWAAMTRLDAVRKILYGGKRFVDEESRTVLERAYIPEDAHAFAKYYNGTDIAQLTPFTDVTGGTNTATSGITFCNSTTPTGTAIGFSQVVSANSSVAPLLKVARGNFSLWASNAAVQCRWDTRSNDNDASLSAIQAYSSSPKRSGSSIPKTTDNPTPPEDALDLADYAVRVSVCESKFVDIPKSEKDIINPSDLDLNNEEGCVKYPNGQFKPIGLLQEYGEKGTINFGLMTGSYSRNKSGGVLRKNVGSMTDEINLNTGIFSANVKSNAANTIIGTLDRLTIYGYSHKDGWYIDAAAGGDNCNWGLVGDFADSQCSNWGNPQTEIYLESLRYLAGQAVNGDFKTDDSSRIPGLKTAEWVKPVTMDNYCAPLNILQFNASTSSYDFLDDQLTTASQIGATDLNKTTDDVGTAEGITGKYFVGMATGTETLEEGKQLCTPKTIASLSNVNGTCPDAPRLQGGFKIAGLAHHARKTGITMSGLDAERLSGTKSRFLKPKVHTYGVALAPAVPKIEIPVPGYSSDAKKNITLLPACRNSTTGGNCAIVDFKVIKQTHVGNTYEGSLYVNWEDSEQGGDYDQDLWGLIDYKVTNTTVKISTRIIAQSSGHSIGFGYVVGGTDNDGFHVQSGITNFRYGDRCTGLKGNICTCRGDWLGRCNHAESGWKSKDFNVSDSKDAAVKSLQQPLYYAAKWGGYADDEATDALIAGQLNPPTYFFATDPRQLAESMRAAFTDIAERTGSSSGVATNSTSLNGSSFLYQAVFNSDNWHGGLNAFKFDAAGKLIRDNSKVNKPPKIEVSTDYDHVQPVPSNRNIFTYDGTSGLDSGLRNFTWDNLTLLQKGFLRAPTDPVGDDTNAQRRLDWLRGSAAAESGADALRSRVIDKEGNRNIIADIVNSTPVFVGETNFRYQRLAEGGNKYAAYLAQKKLRTPKVVVGANDGKLHVFHANTLQELYAYVPNLVFPKLRYVTAANYGRSTNPHQYLLDGPLTVSDVYDGTNWRTIVVGTLGGGGRGVFGVDVSSDTEPKVLFEISEQDFPELGYVLGKPIIMPLKDGRWGAIFGNGSDSGNTGVATQSHLFVVDIFDAKNKSKTKIISTGAGRGLSAPAVLPDVNGVATAVYAGDLNGHLWKFDLSDPTLSNTALTNKVKLLFHATTGENTPKEQPITAAPTLGVNSSMGGTIMVYFGTGKYFEENDHRVSSANPRHSFYAIADIGTKVNRDSLAEKVLDSSSRLITLKDGPIVWQTADITNGKNGWFMNFSQLTEERVISKALLIADKLVFPTIIPKATQCDYGGNSWLVEVPAVGDKFIGYQVLKDPPKELPLTTAAIGFALTKDAASVQFGTTLAEPDQLDANDNNSSGRQSWRELD
jgi:type IV pilus assembly protein PilY1